MKLLFTGIGFGEALTFAELSAVDREGRCSAFSGFVGDPAADVHEIEPESNNIKNLMTFLPPCDSLALAKMLLSFFIAVVLLFRTCLEKNLSAFYIVALEEEHVALWKAYVKEESFRSMYHAIYVNTGFCEAWSLIQNRFPKLCKFNGGLLSV